MSCSLVRSLSTVWLLLTRTRPRTHLSIRLVSRVSRDDDKSEETKQAVDLTPVTSLSEQFYVSRLMNGTVVFGNVPAWLGPVRKLIEERLMKAYVEERLMKVREEYTFMVSGHSMGGCVADIIAAKCDIPAGAGGYKQRTTGFVNGFSRLCMAAAGMSCAWGTQPIN
jgi:hypothetical protein